MKVSWMEYYDENGFVLNLVSRFIEETQKGVKKQGILINIENDYAYISTEGKIKKVHYQYLNVEVE